MHYLASWSFLGYGNNLSTNCVLSFFLKTWLEKNIFNTTQVHFVILMTEKILMNSLPDWIRTGECANCSQGLQGTLDQWNSFRSACPRAVLHPYHSEIRTKGDAVWDPCTRGLPLAFLWLYHCPKEEEFIGGKGLYLLSNNTNPSIQPQAHSLGMALVSTGVFSSKTI